MDGGLLGVEVSLAERGCRFFGVAAEFERQVGRVGDVVVVARAVHRQLDVFISSMSVIDSAI